MLALSKHFTTKVNKNRAGQADYYSFGLKRCMQGWQIDEIFARQEIMAECHALGRGKKNSVQLAHWGPGNLSPLKTCQGCHLGHCLNSLQQSSLLLHCGHQWLNTANLKVKKGLVLFLDFKSRKKLPIFSRFEIKKNDQTFLIFEVRWV